LGTKSGGGCQRGLKKSAAFHASESIKIGGNPIPAGQRPSNQVAD
jgi:hypothetical protein